MAKEWLGCEAEKLFQESTDVLWPYSTMRMLRAMPRCALEQDKAARGWSSSSPWARVSVRPCLSMGISSQHRVGAYRNPCKDAEVRASANARERKDWSWKKWARRVDEYLKHMNAYLWPDLIIIGAGSAKGRQILAALDC